MRWSVVVALATACSSPSSSAGDAATGDAAIGVSDTDPAWPADVPLPAEFDFPPYLNLLDPTTVVVSWRTTNATTGVVRCDGNEAASTTSGNVHHVTLSNLSPATAYHYEVAIDGSSAVRNGVFVTPGATQWRFVHAGEFHAPSESSGVAQFAEEVRAFRPHVVLESGDMVDDGTDLADWRSYMRTSAPWISNVLLLPAHSNHVNGSGGNANLMSFFVLPNNERWYLTRYGQVEFFSLDSTYDANSDVASAEMPWLGSAVAAAHDDNEDPKFVIAAWHHPACSSQYYTRASSRQWIHDNFVATFKTNGGVDLIFAAHDKYYERSTITGDIVHVITNIGNISPEIPGGNHPDCTAIKTLRNTRSTALISIDGSTLSAKVIDEAGTELDTFSLTK